MRFPVWLSVPHVPHRVELLTLPGSHTLFPPLGLLLAFRLCLQFLLKLYQYGVHAMYEWVKNEL